MEPEKLSTAMSFAVPALLRFREFYSLMDRSPHELAMAFAASACHFAKLVVGVETPAQL